jgi:hypothetical protein
VKLVQVNQHYYLIGYNVEDVHQELEVKEVGHHKKNLFFGML